jgi:hypothetical protein
MEPGKQRTFRFDEVIMELKKPGLNKAKLQAFCDEAGLLDHLHGGGYVASQEAIDQRFMYTGWTYRNYKNRPFVVVTRKGLNHLRKLIKKYPRLIIPGDSQLKIKFPDQ